MRIYVNFRRFRHNFGDFLLLLETQLVLVKVFLLGYVIDLGDYLEYYNHL